jgi:hypothetical protein
VNPKHPPGPPMTLGNMRELRVHHLIAFCNNDACRHLASIHWLDWMSTPCPLHDHHRHRTARAL